MTSSPSSAFDRRSASFELLDEQVRRWIWQEGWDELHDIQERSIPILLQEEADVLIVAPTAGGKTEAAFLPIISRLCGCRLPGFAVLYLSPLKALINDQFRRLDRLCEAVQLPVHRWHGDVASAAKARARKHPAGIVLMTPESLEALLVRRGMEVPHLFSALQAVVIDELHAFIGTERGVQLQSLLCRLERSTGRRVRRIGLSATLGDADSAASYLRPRGGSGVVVLESRDNRAPIMFQLRGYESDESPIGRNLDGTKEAGPASCHVAVAQHLFNCMRGKHALVFARSRSDVEFYADLLRETSEGNGVPNEFYPHHANLSRKEREHVEHRLRTEASPTTVLCTSSLELGIDVGQVDQVAQIGAPFSVASLRQRIGRSGRRRGKAAAMRLYVIERAWRHSVHPIDLLRCELLQAIAMVRLLARDWCETPRVGGLHLSTLVHQILALVAQHGGIRAGRAYEVLCQEGPFAAVTRSMFVRILRSIGADDARLLEQSADGTLLLGAIGERIVDSYDFYSVFVAPEEYRVVSEGNELGKLPVATHVFPEMSIIFCGRRWRVLDVNHERAIISVAPSRSGAPPIFGGGAGEVDPAIAAEMHTIYEGEDTPAFLDEDARSLLSQARHSYRELGLFRTRSVQIDGRTYLFPWTGTIAANTLLLALRRAGYTASLRHTVIEIEGSSTNEVLSALSKFAAGDPPASVELAAGLANLTREKFDRFLPRDLLIDGIATDRLDAKSIPRLSQQLLSAPEDLNEECPPPRAGAREPKSVGALAAARDESVAANCERT